MQSRRKSSAIKPKAFAGLCGSRAYSKKANHQRKIINIL